MFQFQTGAIRSENAKQIETDQTSFNSKLVRLEVLQSISDMYVSKSFQFQTGAIRSREKESKSSVLISFNSKLVRLEVHRLRFLRLLFFVSIPNWFD